MASMLRIPDRPAISRVNALRRTGMAILLIAIIVVPFWQIHLIDTIWPADHADLKDVWISVHNILKGRNPYSSEGMRDTQIAYYGHAVRPQDKTTAAHFLDPVPVDPRGFLYPAHIVLLLGPLGVLSWNAARLVFLCASVPLLLLGFWAAIQVLNLRLSRSMTALAIYVGVCSWPVMWGLRHQQPTVVVVPLTFLAAFLLSRNRPTLAGVLMALATVKPQLSLPLLLWMILWAWTHCNWRFIVSLLISITGLLLATEAIFPHWFPQWLAVLRQNGAEHGGVPLDTILGHQLGLALTTALVLWVAFLLWRMRECPADSPEFGLCFAIVTCVTASTCLGLPLLIYNQAVLFPACLVVIVAKPASLPASIARTSTIILAVWGYAAVLISILGELARGVHGYWLGVCFLNPALPAVTTTALGFCILTIEHASSSGAWKSRRGALP